ncbi:MAG: GIY-YIG nuclease family protein [Gordonia sp. (in: high G+C Gram-positive bacteria)]
MSSRGTARLAGTSSAPVTKEIASDVQMLRTRLKQILAQQDSDGRKCGAAKWGVYAFYDFDGEPIYVGQTREKLSGRIGRHLTNQRSDAVAMRILDPLEVAEIEVWPLWHLQSTSGKDKTALAEIDSLEYSVWRAAIEGSKFSAILNEKRPPSDTVVPLPESFRGQLYEGDELDARRHADVRVARRAEAVSRLADVVRERGEVSAGLRRTLAVQTLRLAYLAAERSALADGRPIPTPDAMDAVALVGDQLADPTIDEEWDDDE